MLDLNEKLYTDGEALGLISKCLSNDGDMPDSDSAIESHRNIRYADFTTKTVDVYDLNLKSVNILYKYKGVSADDWDGEQQEVVVFKFDKGLAIATFTGWWGPTFSGDTYTIDIHESHNFDIFDKTCLTDEIRLKMKELVDNAVKEVILEDVE